LGEAEAPPSASSPGTPVACALGNGAKVKQKFGGSVKLPFPPGLNSISQRLSARELRPAERRKELDQE